MDFAHTHKALSNEVEEEMDSLILDENFAFNSQDVFRSISDNFSSFEAQNVDSFHEAFQNEVDFPFGEWFMLQKENEFCFPQQEASQAVDLGSKVPEEKVQESLKESLPVWRPELSETDGVNEKALNYSNGKSESDDEAKTQAQAKPCKAKCNRHVTPSEFLSLKRTDVVMKSIFRMMRRYYCQLMEDTTGYNRKEKQCSIKHQELIKKLSLGVDKLGFSGFAENMPFYYAAFAYPNDMRKILEESKSHYRTKNDLLSQALFIVRLVDNCFNRYSKKVLQDVLSVPQFSFLINHFLNNVDDLSEYPKPFQKCSKILNQARSHVDKFDKSQADRLSRNNSFMLKEEFFMFNMSDSWVNP
mgnify:CR=1 FL=1